MYIFVKPSMTQTRKAWGGEASNDLHSKAICGYYITRKEKEKEKEC